MSGFSVHSFCDSCGKHRGELPFGKPNGFFDRNRGPCGSCGESGPGHQHTARSVRVGFWPWQREWRDRDGNRVDLPESEAPDGAFYFD